MSDDIVTRLRQPLRQGLEIVLEEDRIIREREEAADEIERLRAIITDLRQHLEISETNDPWERLMRDEEQAQ